MELLFWLIFIAVVFAIGKFSELKGKKKKAQASSNAPKPAQASANQPVAPPAEIKPEPTPVLTPTFEVKQKKPYKYKFYLMPETVSDLQERLSELKTKITLQAARYKYISPNFTLDDDAGTVTVSIGGEYYGKALPADAAYIIKYGDKLEFTAIRVIGGGVNEENTRDPFILCFEANADPGFDPPPKYIEPNVKTDDIFNNSQSSSNIPKAQITVCSECAPEKDASELEQFSFSNLTVRTRLDKLADFVGIDVETTGLYPADCEIVSIAAIRFRNFEPVEIFETYCKPKNGIKPAAARINHITADMVEDKPYFGQIAQSLVDFVGKDNIVGHNLSFDLNFITRYGADVSSVKRKYYDTLKIARNTIPKQVNHRSDWDFEDDDDDDLPRIADHKLPTLCEWYGIPYADAHNAAADCLVLGKLLHSLALEHVPVDPVSANAEQ